MVVVSYGGLQLDDAVTYYIYAADLESDGSLVHGGNFWALGLSGRYYAFQSTKSGRPQASFQFRVAHLGDGLFELRSPLMNNEPMRSNQVRPIDVGASIYNTHKKNSGTVEESKTCRDDFDCKGLLQCRLNNGLRTCQVSSDKRREYSVDPGSRYGSAPDFFFDWKTRPCKWTECQDGFDCGSGILLLNPGTEFQGNNGWEFSNESCHWGGDCDSYTCYWAWQHHRLCCPKDAVPRVQFTFQTDPAIQAARFGALSAGSFGGDQAAVLRLSSTPVDSAALCGVTDYLDNAPAGDLIPFVPMLVPLKLTPAKVFNAYMIGETLRGDEKRTRATKFRVVFSTKWFA
jgi:hypothetical protein